MSLSYQANAPSRTFHLLDLVDVRLLEIEISHLVQHCLELLGELVPGGRPCLDLLSSYHDLMGLPPQNEIHQTRHDTTQRYIDQEAQTVKDEARAADDEAGNHGVKDEVSGPETLEQLEFERLESNGGAHLQPSLKTEPVGRTAVGGKLGKGQVIVSQH